MQTRPSIPLRNSRDAKFKAEGGPSRINGRFVFDFGCNIYVVRGDRIEPGLLIPVLATAEASYVGSSGVGENIFCK